MKVHVATELDCSAEAAWNEVQKVSLLVQVASPLITFRAATGKSLPEYWRESDTVAVRTYLFGVLPLGKREIQFVRVSPEQMEAETREHDPLIRRWDHFIKIEPVGTDRAIYSDTIEIDAGWLTVPVWLFAQWFYRHRHRRWKQIARTL